jgi:hypothetical protein
VTGADGVPLTSSVWFTETTRGPSTLNVRPAPSVSVALTSRFAARTIVPFPFSVPATDTAVADETLAELTYGASYTEFPAAVQFVKPPSDPSRAPRKA